MTGESLFTYDRGEHWRFVENLPLAQFYHISLDDAVPFNVYGGLQDNGSWFGPSTVWEARGIMNLTGGAWEAVTAFRSSTILRIFATATRCLSRATSSASTRRRAKGSESNPCTPTASTYGSTGTRASTLIRSKPNVAVPGKPIRASHERSGPELGDHLSRPHDERA